MVILSVIIVMLIGIIAFMICKGKSAARAEDQDPETPQLDDEFKRAH